MNDPAEQRRRSRRARRALSLREQRAHSRDLARLVRGQPWFLRARRVAAYMAADGELDPGPLLAGAPSPHKRLYLPVLRPHPQTKLWFLHHPPGGPLALNRFGIPEPPVRHRHLVPPWALDLVLVPLVAFDAQCNRLGMGGGFYDRTLAFLKHRRRWRRPRLVGVAHECQRAELLPVQPWDVPLDMVVTERRIYRRPNRTASV